MTLDDVLVADGNQYRDCPFCGKTHMSPWVDVLEEQVLACRDLPGAVRGSLEEWEGKSTVPIAPEVDAYSTRGGGP